MTFEKVRPQVNFPELEQEMLGLWNRIGAFEKSVENRPKDNPFVFYEGPPTANGRPGFHHALARAFKDLIPRYKTMRGYRVERKGGWDCHGLPVELEVEKELGLSGKDEIEGYGVEEFNNLCRDSVFRYVGEWRRMSDRLGFWANMDDAYWTLENSYMESVWWSLKRLYENDLLYEGYKVTAHCPRDQTSLSSAEVAMGYEDITDPSVYVRLPLEDAPETSLLVWTTTPWTLVSNTAVAAHPGIEYATVQANGERLILARDLLDTVLGEGEYEVLDTHTGDDLAGKKYRRPFDYLSVEDSESLFTVVLGEHVTTAEGTGLVHTAPAYGEDDARMGRLYGLPTLHPVKSDGTFDERVGEFTGQFVKDADPGLTEELREKGVLYRAQDYEHAYPHCWRCGTPLLYYAKKAWYARTTAVLGTLLEENEKIGWVPENVKWGRFGDWLRNNVDWALSRERYWGTPLPVWRTESGATVVIGSAEELRELAMDPVPDDLHRPYIDEVRIKHPETGEEARRVPEVLDAWFDSGSMPYAQWGYPNEEGSGEELERSFPADYICEAVDQTRGWFYSLLACSTMLFGETSYKNCLVLGHVLDPEGKKMSKSRGNVVDPWEVFERHGADALRWALYTATSPGNPRRFSQDQVEEATRKYLLTLWNTYSFFVTYARIDGFEPEKDYVAPAERSLMDRWALSELQLTIERVTERMEEYDVTAAGRAISEFVDELSNWYVRRSRRRFWKGEDDSDKKAAHSTLYECLVAVTKLTAPFTPFVAEALYQNLVVDTDGKAPESVHVADWPEVDGSLVDRGLSERMGHARRVVALGRAARNATAIKTRQPLPEVVVVPGEREPKGFRDGVESLAEIATDELNVKRISFGEAGDVTAYALKPNLSVVGPEYGKLAPAIRAALAEAPPEEGARAAAGEPVTITADGQVVTLTSEELLVEPTEREGYALEREGSLTVALDTRVDDSLVDEGLVRELVHGVQNLRRERGFEIEESILVELSGSERLTGLLSGGWGDYFKGEVLARELRLGGEATGEGEQALDIEGERVRVSLSRPE
ncbi:isoleucine--tRNA ligase [soil metagenome]